MMGDKMGNENSLRDIISFNSGFKTAVNLHLSLNKPDKVLGYIPTKSSVDLLGNFVNSVLDNREQATLLVGPYGKGKSYLLLVLLAIISMKRTKENEIVIKKLLSNINGIDEIGNSTARSIEELWSKDRYLPVLVSATSGDIEQAFIYALNEALKREGLEEIAPETYYTIAIDRINDWKNKYETTYDAFEKEIRKAGSNINNMITNLKLCSKEALDLFKTIYPKITSGSEFNPMAESDVLLLYKNISEKLSEEYGFSGVYIIFDEFSKFIESQNGSTVGTNMKLIQDVCELANDSNEIPIFFTMVAHKSIKEYGKYLSIDLINSFTGIEGRIVEKFFVTSSKNNYELIKNAIIKDSNELLTINHVNRFINEDALDNYYQLPVFRSNFPRMEFNSVVLKGCYPLNPIAAYLLLNISEKVAQNERTLFTFISNNEPNSMARYVENHSNGDSWSIGADLIYDYFSPLFKKDVGNEYVHNIWLSAEYVLEKCSSEDQKKIIKAIAVIHIVNKEDEVPTTEKYLSLCVDVSDCSQELYDLVANQFIYKKNSNDTFVFKTKAGAELKTEIKKQRELKGENVNYAKALLDLTGNYYVIPRRYNALHNMTRYFVNEYMQIEDFLSINSSDAILNDLECDGKVITLFSFNEIKQDVVRKHIKKLADDRIVIVCPKKKVSIQKQLKDFEIVQGLQDNQVFINNYAIQKNELPLLLEDLTTEIETIISRVYEEDSETKVYRFFNGKLNWGKDVEQVVNDCCKDIYPLTPIINNEMVNRRVISTGQTKKARIKIIEAILNNKCEEEYAEGNNQEATIYRSLFLNSNLLTDNKQSNLHCIIERMHSFINDCCDKKSSLTDLISLLTGKPFGMRLGVIPIYFSFVLSQRHEDIIVYSMDQEVQLNAAVVIDMCDNPNDYSLFVSKEDLLKEKYINELNLLFNVNDNRNLSENRIKDIVICMQRWFRALPQVSRNIADVDYYINDETRISAMKSIKKALQSVEFNPFELLFVSFPRDFGSNNLEKTFLMLDECKTLFDDYYTMVLDKTVEVIFEVWGLKRNKEKLYHLLPEWYENQSVKAKQGLYDGRITNVMSCLENLNVFNEHDVAKKLVKAVTDVYIENWQNGSIEDFKESLAKVKLDIEAIKDGIARDDYKLTFYNKNGVEIVKQYSYSKENNGSILKNIIEDTLEEFDDLSVNDRVAILLEMIEKVIK